MATKVADLRVWQAAMSLTELIYQITAKLPPSERFGLLPQMRRSARSVTANIAEGYGRGRTGDYRRFLSYASGSLAELETDLELVRRLELLPGEEVEAARRLASEVGRLLSGLRRSLRQCSGGPDA
jgi:four helix bundle protein